jgi:hypothetical protein
VAQALSWAAGQTRDLPKRLERTRQIPQLITGTQIQLGIGSLPNVRIRELLATRITRRPNALGGRGEIITRPPQLRTAVEQ